MVNAKKCRICIAAVLFLSILFTGCESAPDNPDTDTAEHIEEITDS